MIRKISFENYKAFKSGELKLKPITILLGANSVGKSSIINLLLMLQQTARISNYKSAFRLHGENVSLGECENIFRNKVKNNDIVVGFEFESPQLTNLLQCKLLEDLIERIIDPIRFIFMRHIRSIRPARAIKSHKKREFSDYFPKEVHDYISEMIPLGGITMSKDLFMSLIDGLAHINNELASINETSDDYIRYYFRRGYHNYHSSRETLETIFDYLSALRLLDESVFNMTFECFCLNVKGEDTIKLRTFIIKSLDKEILNVKFDYALDSGFYKDVKIRSDFSSKELLCEENSKQQFIKLLNHNSTIFSWMDPYDEQYRDFYFEDVDNDINTIDTKIVSQIIGISLSSIRRNFTKELVNHVSPLRAHPKRYYFLDNANINTSINTLDGNSLTEVLKENAKVRAKVNEWLDKFDLQVNVSTLQDIIHKLKIRQYALDLDITDVGFGISQILPIIVQGFLSFENSLTMIEQPEIHLHPKMQADLADLFIDIVNKGETKSGNFDNAQKYLLIETHSEYLLRRLRRRIAEGKISSEDVAIYFLEHPDDGQLGTIINEKTISSNGYFDWPQDFYAKELLNDTTEFIKQSFRNL